MPNEKLGRIAYLAYCSEINHPLDEWQDLKNEEREGWRAAATAVILNIGKRPEDDAEDGPVAD